MTLELRDATEADRSEAAVAIAQAFTEDPVVRWLMPRRSERRDRGMWRTMLSRIHHAPGSSQVVLRDGRIVGVALWDPPDVRHSFLDGALANLSFLRSLHVAGSVRGLRLERSFARVHPKEPLWYLSAIGATVQGQGVGSALLEHRLGAISGPAYLEATTPDSLRLYERHGFELLAEFRVGGDGPSVWAMRRP